MYDALNSQNVEAHDNYWTEDMVWHGPTGLGNIPGRDGFKYQLMKPFYKTYPDYYVEDEIQIACGDWVAATGKLTGTPQEDWLGVPPTGKQIVMRYSDFWRVENGRLAENWVMVDNIGVMHQLANKEAPAQSPNRKFIYRTENESTLAQQNLALVHRMVEALNAHDLEAQNEFWTEDMIWHGPPGFGDIHGLEAFKHEVVKTFYTAFPDFNGGVDIELADDNWVAATGTVTGTHQGTWFGIPATGKRVQMRYSDFWHIENGKLAENWVMIDHVGVLEQLGADPMSVTFG